MDHKLVHVKFGRKVNDPQ